MYMYAVYVLYMHIYLKTTASVTWLLYIGLGLMSYFYMRKSNVQTSTTIPVTLSTATSYIHVCSNRKCPNLLAFMVHSHSHTYSTRQSDHSTKCHLPVITTKHSCYSCTCIYRKHVHMYT